MEIALGCGENRRSATSEPSEAIKVARASFAFSVERASTAAAND